MRTATGASYQRDGQAPVSASDDVFGARRAPRTHRFRQLSQPLLPPVRAWERSLRSLEAGLQRLTLTLAQGRSRARPQQREPERRDSAQ